MVVPYLIKEHQRKYNPNSGIRILNENDDDIEKNLEGKVAIITGGSRGLGIEVVRVFLRKGAHVITTSSSTNRDEIDKRYRKITKNIDPGAWKLEIWNVDLMSMQSVMSFVDRFKRQNSTQLNYLICNAGVMFPKYKLSGDGFESQFSINYAGHVLMSYHLLPYLYRSGRQSGHQSRLVLTSSCLHHIPTRIRYNDLQSHQAYSPHYAYGQSKVFIVMFIRKLSVVLDAKSDWSRYVRVFTLHPGLVDTDLLTTIDLLREFPFLARQMTFRVSFHFCSIIRSSDNLFRQDIKSGAETVIYAALSDQLEHRNGEYLEDSRVAQSSTLSRSVQDQDRVWTITYSLLNKWTDGEWFDDY